MMVQINYMFNSHLKESYSIQKFFRGGGEGGGGGGDQGIL